jgi:hypothetical protein
MPAEFRGAAGWRAEVSGREGNLGKRSGGDQLFQTLEKAKTDFPRFEKNNLSGFQALE